MGPTAAGAGRKSSGELRESQSLPEFAALSTQIYDERRRGATTDDFSPDHRAIFVGRCAASSLHTTHARATRISNDGGKEKQHEEEAMVPVYTAAEVSIQHPRRAEKKKRIRHGVLDGGVSSCNPHGWQGIRAWLLHPWVGHWILRAFTLRGQRVQVRPCYSWCVGVHSRGTTAAGLCVRDTRTWTLQV